MRYKQALAILSFDRATGFAAAANEGMMELELCLGRAARAVNEFADDCGKIDWLPLDDVDDGAVGGG